jgi:aldehyde dehydrogenase (NAD+)
MGGKNPVIVLEDADLDLAVESTVQGAFGSTGQRCTATSRAIVVNEIADEFVKRLVVRASKLIIGDGADPKTNVGPAVDQHQFETVLKYLNIGREDGAEMIYGGRASEPQGVKLNGIAKLDDSALRHGFYLEPTVFDRVTPDMRIAQEEIFGPVLSVMRARDFDEALHWANNVQFGLSSSIFSNDPNRIFRFVDKIETGMTHVNSATTGGEAHIPFGGIKGSGLGEREQGSTALDFYSELKVVYMDYTGQKRTSNIY